MAASTEPESRGKAWTFVDQRIQSKLPPEDFLRVANVRRQLWEGGAAGSVAGAAAGAALFALQRQLLKPKWLTKNHAFLYILGGAACCSFIGANIMGYGKMAALSDVFERHQLETALKQHTAGGKDEVTSYRLKQLVAAKEAEKEEKENAKKLLAALEAKADKQQRANDENASAEGTIQYDDDLSSPSAAAPAQGQTKGLR
jgi:hypothetical protein